MWRPVVVLWIGVFLAGCGPAAPRDGDYVKLWVRPVGEPQLTRIHHVLYGGEAQGSTVLVGPSVETSSTSRLPPEQAEAFWSLAGRVLRESPASFYWYRIENETATIRIKMGDREKTYQLTRGPCKGPPSESLHELVETLYGPVDAAP